MSALLYGSIWLAMAGFVAGEFGRARDRAYGGWSRGAWLASCAGLVVCVLHIVLAMAVRHHWSHASALAGTARLTEEVYGVAWAGGLYVNYLFVAVWLVELVRWGRGRSYPQRQPAWAIWAIRTFFFVIVINATVIFAAPSRRTAGLVLCAALCVAWFRPLRRN